MGRWKFASPLWLLERRHPEEFGRSTPEEAEKARKQENAPTTIEHEVLARIKKQNGVKDIAVKVAEKLQLIRNRKAAAEAEAKLSITNLSGDD